MTGTRPVRPAGRAGLADWLVLAASPCFAVMACATLWSDGQATMICSAATPWAGMAPMYALMSLFHAAPWLRRIAG